jgi:hypothetical protein
VKCKVHTFEKLKKKKNRSTRLIKSEHSRWRQRIYTVWWWSREALRINNFAWGGQNQLHDVMLAECTRQDHLCAVAMQCRWGYQFSYDWTKQSTAIYIEHVSDACILDSKLACRLHQSPSQNRHVSACLSGVYIWCRIKLLCFRNQRKLYLPGVEIWLRNDADCCNS